jgi:hypothetical protein
MSRVEPIENPAPRRESAENPRRPSEEQPDKAEGDERTIEEALRNQDE